MRFIIVPGLNGSDHNHWQSVWESTWLPGATRIAPASWTTPDLPDWTKAITDALTPEPTVLIAHSLGCHAAAHYLTEETELSPVAATNPLLPQPDGPTRVRPSAHLSSPADGSPPSTVRSHQSAVRGVFLVAPPDPTAPTFPADLLPTFTDLTPSPLPVPAVLIASDNDPYCTVDAAARLATAWGVPLIVTGSHGHLNSDSNLGSWPQGQQLLTSFLAGLGARTE
ncbi:RBBP9/YdeN family alpha/beta hydrolase [Kribbella sp. NPDC002412]